MDVHVAQTGNEKFAPTLDDSRTVRRCGLTNTGYAIARNHDCLVRLRGRNAGRIDYRNVSKRDRSRRQRRGGETEEAKTPENERNNRAFSNTHERGDGCQKSNLGWDQ
jgi:hypothetical protein